MSNRNHLTYYFSGKTVVKTFSMAAGIPDDMDWMSLHPDNRVVGQHFNKSWWMLNPAILGISKLDLLSQMEHMDYIANDHELIKIIEMHEIMNALPEPEN